MRIEEIFVGPERDRYINDKKNRFINSSSIAKISDFHLRKRIDNENIEYGLLNTTDDLVGYLGLEKYDGDIYRVIYSEIAPEIRGHGYGTFLYDYAIMNDNLKVLSDTRQTPHAKALWDKFRKYKKFDVVAYNMNKNKEEPQRTEDEVYSSEDLVWLAKSAGETINEALHRINSRHDGKAWEVLWYGPFVSNEY